MKYLPIAVVLLATIAFSCVWNNKNVKGNGNVITDRRDLSGFTKVRQNGSFDVYLANGPFEIKVEAEENLLPYILTEISGSQLRIRTADDIRLKSTKTIKIYITAPEIEEVQSAGSGDIYSVSTLQHPDKISFVTTGSADMEVQVDAPNVKTEITGSGNIEIAGQTKNYRAEITGSGDIQAKDLKSEEAVVDIRGSGNASVFASVKLTVDVAGSGDVTYRGSVQQVNSNMRGSGTLKKLN